MVKRKLYFLILICFSLTTEAQVYHANIITGANFSQVDGDQIGGYNKLGLALGISIQRQVKDQWSAGFNLLYMQKGSKKVLDPDFIDPTLVLRYHYVELPLVATYHFSKEIHFYGGPAIGVNVYNQREDNGLRSEEEELRPWELGLHLGGYYQFKDKWNIELRHSYSLWSIRDYPFQANSFLWFGTSGWYNRLFTVGLRYDLGS